MGDLRRGFDRNADDGDRIRQNSLLKSALLDVPRDRRGTGASEKRMFQDAVDCLANVDRLIEELNALKGHKPDTKIPVSDPSGVRTEMPVSERLAQLQRLIDEQFQHTIKVADNKDFVKAAELLTRIEKIMEKRARERVAAYKLDLSVVPGDYGKGAGRDPFEEYGTAELRLLQGLISRVIYLPAVARLQYAAFLADRGKLDEAKDKVREAQLHGANGEFVEELRRSLARRVRRKELANGEDPLELARLARQQVEFGKTAEANTLFEKAQRVADAIHSEAERRLVKLNDDIRKANPERAEALRLDKECLEDLFHASAAVRFNRAEFAAAHRRFSDVRRFMEEADRLDPQFVVERSGDFLNMLLFATTEGAENSVFLFHEHLVKFQKYLSPQSYDPVSAANELRLAEESAGRLPAEAIERVSIAQRDKLQELETSLTNARDLKKQEQIQSQIAETKLALEGLDLLKHAKGYARLMSGVFELSRKNFAKAKQMFDEVEEIDFDFAKKSQTQLKELREAADKPAALAQERSKANSLIKELVCSAAAIAAGAAVVLGTGWSGPLALAAGAGTGAIVRSGMKRLVFGEQLEWYDPVLGAVDGLSGSAGSLVRTAALERLSNSAKVLTASERALAATGKELAALNGMIGLERAAAAERLALEGTRAMGAQLSPYTRMASRLPFLSGDSAYQAALASTRNLARINARNRLYAEAAGGAAFGLIYETGQYLPRVVQGEYNDPFSLGRDFAWDLGRDTVFAGVGGRLMARFGPGAARFAPPLTYALPELHERELQKVRMERINTVLSELEQPSVPQDVRQRYLTLPGPKVDTFTPGSR